MAWYICHIRPRPNLLCQQFPCMFSTSRCLVPRPLPRKRAWYTLYAHACNRPGGLSVCGTCIGAAIHADDVRTCAATKQTVAKQNEIITSFTNSSCFNLNARKLEVIKAGQKPTTSQSLEIGGHAIPLSESVKCLGVLWQYNLSATRAVTE